MRYALVPACLVLSACVGVVDVVGVKPPLLDGGTGLDAGDDSGLPDAGTTPDGGEPPDSGTDSGTPDAAVPPDAGEYDAGPCGTLDTRITTVQVDVSPAQVDYGNSSGWSNNRPVIFGPMASGGAKIAWSSSGHIHVTPVDVALQRAGADAVLVGDEVRGFVAHDDGAVALLVVRGTSMVLVRLKPDGTTDFEKPIVNDTPNMTTPGSRWVDSWGHEGRLLWTGANYVAYFGHTKYWGAQGKHQGDFLGSYSITGQEGGPASWDWGCSHSLDLRLAWDGARVAPVCLADCYATKGVLLSDSTVLQAEPSGNCAGSSDGELGGLAPLPGGGFAFTFSTLEGRTSRDVGFIRLSASMQPAATVWLTTAAGDESQSNLARYGSSLLAAWHEGATRKLAVLSADGAVLEGPVALPSDWTARDDFASWPAGDVGWAQGAGSTLSVTRVRFCP